MKFDADPDTALGHLKRIGLGAFQAVARTDVETQRISVIPNGLDADYTAVHPTGVIEINSSLLGATGRSMEPREIKDTFDVIASAFAYLPQYKGSEHQARARSGFPELGAGAMAVAAVGELAFKQQAQGNQNRLVGDLAVLTPTTLSNRAGTGPEKMVGESLVVATYGEPGKHPEIPAKGTGAKLGKSRGELNALRNGASSTAEQVLHKAGYFSDAPTFQESARKSRRAMDHLARKTDQISGRIHSWNRLIPDSSYSEFAAEIRKDLGITMEPPSLGRPVPGRNSRRVLDRSLDRQLGN